MRTSRLHRLITGLRWLAQQDADTRAALGRAGRLMAIEHVTAVRAPGIDPTAIVSPLASLRFVDRVRIGPKATIGPWCCVWGGWSKTTVSIGAGALLGPGVMVAAGNHRIDGTGWIRDEGFDEADASVGEGAWIGAHVTIVGAHVGAGAVVAANAVVTTDVPAGAIVGGVPARLLGWRPGHGPTDD